MHSLMKLFHFSFIVLVTRLCNMEKIWKPPIPRHPWPLQDPANTSLFTDEVLDCNVTLVPVATILSLSVMQSFFLHVLDLISPQLEHKIRLKVGQGWDKQKQTWPLARWFTHWWNFDIASAFSCLILDLASLPILSLPSSLIWSSRVLHQ